MNILEFTKEFQAMEIEGNFFEMSTKDNIFYWDIVRYELFNTIFRDYLSERIVQKREKSKDCKIILVKKILGILKDIISDSIYMHKKRDSSYVVFTCSRNLINRVEKDIISEDYLKIIGEKTFVIETYSKKSEEKNFKITLLFYMKRLWRLPNLNQSFTVNEIINDRFNINVDFNELINMKLNEYRIETRYYKFLLKRINPKAVFFVQNGIQKALIHSCKKLQIPIIEFQHGIINFCHPAYSYPIEVKEYKNKEIVVPDYLLSFSDFWNKNVNYPVDESISMGNTHYYLPAIPMTKERDEITFISADFYHNKIEIFLSILLERNRNIKINLKLHPNQDKDKESIIQKYRSNKNLNVYYNEITLSQLFQRSFEVIVVTSTSAYEALQAGCNLGIIQDDISFDISDLFNLPNVRIIKEPLDILNTIYHEPNDPIFFDQFKKKKFVDFLEHINKGDNATKYEY